MGVIPNQMGDYAEKSNEMKVIENAAIMWMGYEPIHQYKDIIEESRLLLDETKAMGYTPVHTEKIAIRGFTQVIQNKFKTSKDIKSNLFLIILGLIIAICTHSKENKEYCKDTITEMKRIKVTEYVEVFKSHNNAVRWFKGLKVTENMQYDVYRDGYTLKHMLDGTYDLTEKDEILWNVCWFLQSNDKVDIYEFEKIIKRYTFLLMNGHLCKVFVINFLLSLGLIKKNDNMLSYLPYHLAKHGGSMNLCTRVLGCNNEFVAKYYIKDAAKNVVS